MNTPAVQLKPGFAKPLWAGNPLVYPKAVELWPSELTLGQWVKVNDATGQTIGHGMYNPNSLYRVRLLAWARDAIEEDTLEAALHHQINSAIHLRLALNLPNEQTNAYRLINSEGDNLSGITVDIYNETAVIAITAAWALVHHTVLESVLREHLPNMQLIWRYMDKSLKQEGWTTDRPQHPVPENTKVQIKELGMQYEMDPYQGQKTGFYCDQRETRALVQRYARGRRVLDLYCFSGAFSLHAARGGALSVHGVDSSQAAIAMATQHAALNQLTDIQFIEDDATHYLSKADEEFDFIILDPPKLAPSHKHLHKALRHYEQINELALRALPANGLLLTCSCSQAVSMQDLQQVLVRAALNAGKSIQMLHHGGAGPDHPINLAFMESAYLKWILVRVL